MKTIDTITFIFPEDCYPIRHELLRKGLPIETTRFPGDYSAGNFHLGYFVDNQLAGIVTYNESECKLFPGKKAGQLRGMAVLEKYQGKSIGGKLCEKTEEIAWVLGQDVLWCNARISAVGFYEKLGYGKTGEEFLLPNAGAHYMMYKELKK